MEKRRYASIDQFRGLTIFWMVFVNTIGNFPVMPRIFKHLHVDNGGFSIADAVLPFFVFISGMGFRIAFMRNRETMGNAKAVFSAIRRFLVLIIVGVVFVYRFKVDRVFWEALTLIGLSGLCTLPVIAKHTYYRIAFALGCIVLFQALAPLQFETMLGTQSGAGVFQPLIFFFTFLMGTLAVDWMEKGQDAFTQQSLLWGFGLFAIGFALSPWLPIGQKGTMHFTYTVYYAGLAFLVFFAFYYIVDVWGMCIPHLTTLGRNALVVYALHYMVKRDFTPVIQGQPIALFLLLRFSVVYLSCFAVARYLQNRKYFITI